MYTQFFNFIEKPFNLTPDPRFLYLSPGHQEALASMIYGIKEKRGFISIIGEIGIGKTTLLHTLFKELGDEVKIIFIFNTKIDFTQLLQNILIELNLTPVSENKIALINQLNDYLIERLAANEIVALIIDEAQNLSAEVLEELRMLSNLETTKDKLLQIVLVGQPELDFILRSHNLRQLKQRIAINSYLTALNHEEQRKYIVHRLTIAGHNGNQIFSTKALDLICKHSSGIPRLINIFCDNALLAAYGKDRSIIDEDIVKEIISDYEQPKMPNQHDSTVQPSYSHRQKPSYPKVILAAIIIIFSMIIVFIFGFNFNMHNSFNKLTRSALARLQILLAKNQNVTDNKQSESPSPQPSGILTSEKGTSPVNGEYSILRDLGLDSAGTNPEVTSPEMFAPSPVPAGPSDAAPAFQNDFTIEKHHTIATANKGDMVSALASKEYGTLNDTICDIIKRANPAIKDLDKIFVGEHIVLPPLDIECLIITEENGTFSIHLATFNLYDNAKQLHEMLSDHGFAPIICPVQIVGSQIWHRVILGYFPNFAAAKEYARNIDVDSRLFPFPVNVIHKALNARHKSLNHTSSNS